MAKAVAKMTVEEIDAEIERHLADNEKDMATKDALLDKMRARAATLDELVGHRAARALLDTLGDDTLAALGQVVAADGIKPKGGVGKPGGS